MQNNFLNVELEEIEIQAQQLESFLLMLEQSLIYDNFGGKIFLPAVSHMSDISSKITERLTELRRKNNSSKDEVNQA